MTADAKPDPDAPPSDEPSPDRPSTPDGLARQALTDPEAALALADRLLDADEGEEAAKALAWAGVFMVSPGW